MTVAESTAVRDVISVLSTAAFRLECLRGLHPIAGAESVDMTGRDVQVADERVRTALAQLRALAGLPAPVVAHKAPTIAVAPAIGGVGFPAVHSIPPHTAAV